MSGGGERLRFFREGSNSNCFWKSLDFLEGSEIN